VAGPRGLEQCVGTAEISSGVAQVANLLCQGQVKRTMARARSKSEIPVYKSFWEARVIVIGPAWSFLFERCSGETPWVD